MIRGINHDELGRLAVLEVAHQVVKQARLVGFGGEVVMRLALADQVIGQLALGEQGIGRDVFVGQVDPRQQRDGHAYFIGLLECFGITG